MSEFVIKNATNNAQFEYTSDAIKVNGSFVKDAASGKLMSINGSCFRPNQGEMMDSFGYFNGYPNGDEMVYDLSQMKRADSELVWDAIEDIEAELLPVAD